MDNFFDAEGKARMGKMLLMLVLFVGLYSAMKFVNEVKSFSSIGVAPSQVNTIDVTGEGEAFAIPDVAMTAFNVEQKAKTIKEAQDIVTKKVANAMAFLKSAGIADKDIKTINYSAYPEYNYNNPCVAGAICTQKQPELLGYTVTQSVAVKIHDTSITGKIVEGLAQAGITGITNTDFTVDNPDAVKADARKQAIDDAQAKAQVLAKDLGVRLVRIVRFTEGNGGGYPTPMYAKDMLGTGGATSSEAQLPEGESKYTSNVTVTYEIR
jgi:uncharacterized protein YggE